MATMTADYTDTFIAFARRFVEMTLHTAWEGISSLPDSSANTLLAIARAAGYDIERISTSDCSEFKRNHCDPLAEGQNRVINYPFLLLSADGEVDIWANGWLSDLIFLVIANSKQSKDTIVRLVAKEIERSVPLTPISLTTIGDFLCELRPRLMNGVSRYFVIHTRDNDNLDKIAGIHASCAGMIYRKNLSDDCDALECQKCTLRVAIPKSVATYGDLREALYDMNMSESARMLERR